MWRDDVDDWARELVADGWLHNQARIEIAIIWIFTLRLPWQLGADIFRRHLYDGNPASSTHSWRWDASLQTRGKTYQAKAGITARYTDGRPRPRARGRSNRHRLRARRRGGRHARPGTRRSRRRRRSHRDGSAGLGCSCVAPATRGFFPFTERIPGLVRDAGVGA